MAFLEYDPNSTLYHYTSALGFKGILETKSLWFSDLTTTNDPREINLGRELLLSSIQSLGEMMPPETRNTFIVELASKLEYYFERRGIMSCSFSHYGDSLPMWREYASNSEGLSIGFRPTAIKDMPIRIQKVEYLKEVSETEFLGLLIRLLAGMVDNAQRLGFAEWLNVTVPLVSAVVSTKHASWEYEGEVRGTHAAVEIDGPGYINGVRIPSYEYPDGNEVCFELKSRGDNGRIKFIPLPFGKYSKGSHDSRKAISEVIIGPKSDLSLEEVENQLVRAGFESFEVKNSDCLLR